MKRLLSCILSLLMMTALLPVSVWAAGSITSVTLPDLPKISVGTNLGELNETLQSSEYNSYLKTFETESWYIRAVTASPLGANGKSLNHYYGAPIAEPDMTYCVVFTLYSKNNAGFSLSPANCTAGSKTADKTYASGSGSNFKIQCVEFYIRTPKTGTIVPATGISGVPTELVINKEVALPNGESGNYTIPENATHKNIDWSIVDSGGTGVKLQNFHLYAKNVTGTVTLKGSVLGGDGIEYQGTYQVKIVERPSADPAHTITKGALTSSVNGSTAADVTVMASDALFSVRSYSVYDRSGGSLVPIIGSAALQDGHDYAVMVTLSPAKGYEFVGAAAVNPSDFTMNGTPASEIDYSGSDLVATFPLSLKKSISALAFTLDVPNDGEEYPAGTQGLDRVVCKTEGIQAVSLSAIMFGKTLSGKVVAGDTVTFVITYEVLPGYEIVPGYTAAINGADAIKVVTSDGVRKVGYEVKIGYNPNIEITKDLPETISFEAGGELTAGITAKGDDLHYQWQLESLKDGKVNVRSVFDIEGATSDTLKLSDVGADYAGKWLCCRVYNEDGNLYSARAALVQTGTKPVPDDCGGNPALCPSAQYADAPKYGHWAHEGIDFCIDRGLMNGTSATTFSPAGTMTRAMVVTVLWRQAGSPEPGGASPFTDLTQEWYRSAVTWAAEKGIVNGISSTAFAPDNSVTREQLAAILQRYAANALGRDTGKTADITGYPDYADVSSYAAAPMAWANAEGLITGSNVNGKTYLLPKNGATREQVATILMRFVKNIATAS